MLAFWRSGLKVVVLFVFQGAFAEDVIRAMTAQGLNLSWLLSLLTVATQIAFAYTSIVLRERPGLVVSAGVADDACARLGLGLGLGVVLRGFLARFRWEYAASALVILVYQLVSNNATFYLAFNTVQLFKTSKVVFVVATSVVLLQRRFSRRVWAWALLLSCGLYALSLADAGSSQRASQSRAAVAAAAAAAAADADGHAAAQTAATAAHLYGYSLMFVGNVCVAVNNVLQEAVMREHAWAVPCGGARCRPRPRARLLSSSKDKGKDTFKDKDWRAQLRDELILFPELLTAGFLLAGAVATGEAAAGAAFFARAPRRLLAELVCSLAITAWGQRLMLDLSHQYGAASATIIVTVRKSITFVVSVALFPKPFSALHALALALISVSAAMLQLGLMQDDARAEREQHARAAADQRQDQRREDAPGLVV
jgi:drug/metabolite transporter (DMT)-like permease